jgi:hypothetical protein
MRSSLKWCVLAAIPVVLLSFLPQARLWLDRGFQWQGAYATVDGDEFLYSAYINALIDGRPRRNDPFSGRDDHPNAPLPESAFSIQFLPPFIISSFGKILGLSASTCFILLIAFSALSAAVTIFWLLSLHIEENHLAALGTLVVLLLGTAVAGEGLMGAVFKKEVSTLGLAFLRRYQPAAAFFLFFAFGALVHCALTTNQILTRRLLAALSGLTLALLIFSYLYLWTAAAAWAVTLFALWFYFRGDNRRQTLEVVGLMTVPAVLALAPYIYFLSHRAQILDETQTLLATHRPDLFRLPELFSVLIVLYILRAVRRKTIQLRDPSLIFALSFAVLPLLLFNQQIITGRSMQPFHFQHFIVNYGLLISIVILATRLLRSISSRLLTALACVIVLWGAAEVALPTEIRVASDVKNDDMVPVLLRLKDLSATDGTLSNLHDRGKTSMLVFSSDIAVLKLLPTWTAQGTMIGLGGLDFGSATLQDRKVFAYLYYSGADTARLAELLHGKSTDLGLNYYARSALFGHERVLPQLSLSHEPVQVDEIEEQLRAYDSYVASFSRSEALKYPFAYVIVLPGSQFDFSRIDRWYERDSAERVGAFELYRVRMRN